MTDSIVFLMREADLIRKCSVEPGLCPPCAVYSQNACPMLSGHMAHYRASISQFATRRCDDPGCRCWAWLAPDGQPARLGAQAESWYALWTKQYQMTKTPEGHLAASFAGLQVLTLRKITGVRTR